MGLQPGVGFQPCYYKLIICVTIELRISTGVYIVKSVYIEKLILSVCFIAIAFDTGGMLPLNLFGADEVPSSQPHDYQYVCMSGARAE